MSSNILYSLPAVSYAVLIFIFSSIPQEEMPKMALLNQDKLLHLVEYTVFGMLLMLAFRKQQALHIRKQAAYYAFGVGLLYAGSDEIHQLFVPGRNASVYDLMADGLGIILGIYLFYRLLRF